MKEDDIQLLSQLFGSLEEAVLKLEEYYKKGHFENFNNLKKFILNIQKKISEVVNAR